MERAGGSPGGGKNEGVVSMTATALRMGKKRVGLGVFGTPPLTIGLVALAALGEVGAALSSLGTDAIALAPRLGANVSGCASPLSTLLALGGIALAFTATC